MDRKANSFRLKNCLLVISVLLCAALVLTWQAVSTAEYSPIVKDDAGLLTEEEETALYREMSSLCRYGTPMFWTTYEDGSYDSLSVQFAEEQLPGGDNWVLFMINMKTRIISVYSKGEMMKSLTGEKAYTVTDHVYRYATDGQYYECASCAFSEIRSILETAGKNPIVLAWEAIRNFINGPGR